MNPYSVEAGLSYSMMMGCVSAFYTFYSFFYSTFCSTFSSVFLGHLNWFLVHFPCIFYRQEFIFYRQCCGIPFPLFMKFWKKLKPWSIKLVNPGALIFYPLNSIEFSSSARMAIILIGACFGVLIFKNGWGWSIVASHFSQKSKSAQIAHLYLTPSRPLTWQPSQLMWGWVTTGFLFS
jgi:hypothetical protein